MHSAQLRSYDVSQVGMIRLNQFSWILILHCWSNRHAFFKDRCNQPMLRYLIFNATKVTFPPNPYYTIVCSQVIISLKTSFPPGSSQLLYEHNMLTVQQVVDTYTIFSLSCPSSRVHTLMWAVNPSDASPKSRSCEQESSRPF